MNGAETEHTDTKDYYQKRRDKSIFKHLKSYFGEDATLQDVENTIGSFEQWRRGQNKKPATIVKELGLLRRMFNIAREQWKWKVSNPVSEIELPKVRNERVRYLSGDEYRRLFEALDNSEDAWLKPCVIIAIDTGLRLTNVCDLLWAEVNLFSRVITISAEKMKNNDHLGIPLTERAFQILREIQKVKCLSGHVFHDKGEKLYDRKVQRAFKKALRKAEITDFHFHDLRHTFASYLRQSGVDLHTISKLMGHKDTRMTNRYSHLSVDTLRDAITKLDVTKWTHSTGKEQGLCP